MGKTSVRFMHGLGDCSNFAFQIPLYTSRGHQIEVECTPDKRYVFEAAGAKVVSHSQHIHNWHHAPAMGSPTFHEPWAGSKSAFNLSASPMPNIGSIKELWDEYMNVRLNLDDFITEEIISDTQGLIKNLPRPIILVHTKGNTGPGDKNLSDGETVSLYHTILDETDAGMILLDWDNRCPYLKSGRMRHIVKDWHGLSLPELYYLMEIADLIIGVDSGPLHFSRFSKTPVIGVWTNHRPGEFVLPRSNSINIISRADADRRYRRLSHNIIESRGGLGSFVGKQAARFLDKRKYVEDPVQDLILQDLIDRTRLTDCPLATFVDRHRSFDMFLRNLPEKALVVETGCIREEDDFGAGFSTYILGHFLKQRGGKLHSVDLDEDHCKFARKWTAAFGDTVSVHKAHSHDFLKGFSEVADAYYLDSADVWSPQFQECCLEEAKLCLPKLKQGGLILIDDSPWSECQITGKGGLAASWLLENGCDLMYHGYQLLFRKK